MAGLFLGKGVDDGTDFELKPKQLRTHGVVVGMTGSGKTGLCVVLLEELLRARIPIIAVDPKGDLGNLGLLFPGLTEGEFAEWAPEGKAAKLAELWQSGLAKHGMSGDDIAKLKSEMDLRIHTPGSTAGLPVDVIGTFHRPADALLHDDEARRELVSDTVSSLLGLVGREGTPFRDPAHVVLSQIVEDAWTGGEDLDLTGILLRLTDPPFEKVGIFPVDTFFPPDDRMELAMALNAVIAAPGFQSWGQGESIDVDRMMRVTDKVPVSVFSLAHLDDSERQFFLGLLLSRVLAWTRTQPGTEALRGVLFFDEVAGFLPPHPKNPASKAPLLTMMKQARAMGMGVVLATQNPVDVDYKALTNAGLWCIGRLNTPQDRDRILKGIGDGDHDATVAGLEKRQFMIHQVGRGTPSVIGTRHALCYLKGPMTRADLKRLVGDTDRDTAVAPSAAPPSPSPSEPDDGTLPAPPPLREIPQRFIDPRAAFSARMNGVFVAHAEPPRPDGAVRYRPALHARLALTFDEDRIGFISERTLDRVWFPLGQRLSDETLEVRLEDADLLDEPPEGARFGALPEWMDQDKELKALSKRILDDVYRSETDGMFVCSALRMYGKPKETREAFEARCREAVQDKIDDKARTLEKKIRTRVERLERRIRDEEAKLVEQQGVAKNQQMAEMVNIGETVLSMFMGRKKSFGSALTRRRASSRAAARVERIEGKIDELSDEAEALREELETELADLQAEQLEVLDTIIEKPVRLEKMDIRLDTFELLWVPVTQRFAPPS